MEPTATKPGVIKELIAVLERAGQRGDFLTAEELLIHLSRKFPQRSLDGMLITIRAQLSRLPHEKDLPVIKRRNEYKKMAYAIGG